MTTVHIYEQDDTSYPVPSIHRAFVILGILSDHPQGLGLSELAHMVGWPKSSIYNILATLALDGYVFQNKDTSRYRMTIKLFSLGSAIVERIDLREIARAHLLDLRNQTGETVNLGLLDGLEAIYLETFTGQGTIQVKTWPGMRLPIHCTALGKTLAAGLSTNEVKALVARTGLKRGTRNTLTTLDELLADLELTRSRGYAIDDEEDEEGMRCIGAPIIDRRGNTVAAVSIAGLSHRLTSDKVPDMAKLLILTVERISDQLNAAELHLTELGERSSTDMKTAAHTPRRDNERDSVSPMGHFTTTI